jgi:hypothetical protein
MLPSVVPAYLYEQYADDEDLQAYIDAYNGAVQNYVNWFNTALLPFYPAQSAPLLDWTAYGIWGLQRTSLASAASTALGMLNTQPLNVAALNAFVPSTQQIFALADDVFQRILTWNVYKADGKRFSPRWLKRRVMRFLVGTNGLDPTPDMPGFQVGCESTFPIGVTIANGVVTVTLASTLLSQMANVSPFIMTLFQDAFQAGAGDGAVLDLPIEYQYVCNIVAAPLLVIVPQPGVSVTGSAGLLTTPVATAEASQGSGSFTFKWTIIPSSQVVVDSNLADITDAGGGTVVDTSDGLGVVITQPNAAATKFSATGLSSGQQLNAVAQCTVTDTLSLQQATATCTVTITHS